MGQMGGGAMNDQLQSMQQTMYIMMQGGANSGGAGGYDGYSSASSYQNPRGGFGGGYQSSGGAGFGGGYQSGGGRGGFGGGYQSGGGGGYKSGGMGSMGKGTRLFIGQAPGGRSRGLTEDITDDHLQSHFGTYGTVLGIVQRKWEDTGKKKVFGFIEFEDADAAQAAIGIHHVAGVPLEVKAYTPPGGAKNGGFVPAFLPGNGGLRHPRDHLQ